MNIQPYVWPCDICFNDPNGFPPVRGSLHGEADDLHKSYVARPVGNLVLKGRKSPTKVGEKRGLGETWRSTVETIKIDR